MISENYKHQLIKETKQVDVLLGQTSTFEQLVREIIYEQNDKAILELIKNLGVLTKIQSFPNMEKKQEQIFELLYKYLGASKIDELFQDLKESSNVSLNAFLNQLNELVGLENVKQQVRDLIDYNQIQHLRVKNGLKKSNKTLHMAFLGNPGTAKTTVARIFGRMYKAIGLLSKGHFIEASRTDLIAEYQGQTAMKVKRLINRAKGGVLFIDEAYSITENDHSDSYGRESLTELTKALEDYRNDLVVIVAGYTSLMEKFFESNPGLKSRFNTFISFSDYSLDELVRIFIYTCNQNDYIVQEEAMEEVRNVLQTIINEKDDQFANGRLVRNLFDDITLHQSKRLSKLTEHITKESLMLITKEDVPKNYTLKIF
ncbi:AAA family ATPase [Paenibacillus taichungensis]|uniref:AAA family ATPase n=2 Tax=Paenibacillus TaxID=44249 RepID=A0ABX2MSA9_9BACL|nr:AAA family ATPase [Paenibacillus taichungensis]NUU56920.1 AAA family ATPase [Paenibacillus taichungensis]PIH60804.1 stage V sporulation protein K [Paenibacillus sp. LK1]